jgi:hypothetical protein
MERFVVGGGAKETESNWRWAVGGTRVDQIDG